MEVLKQITPNINREFEDADFLSFGKDEECQILLETVKCDILHSEIDKVQFKIFNRLGNLFLSDWSNVHPTRIKVELGKFYALNKGDFINLGLV